MRDSRVSFICLDPGCGPGADVPSLGIGSLPGAASVAVNLIWQIVRLYCVAGIAVAVLYATDCLEKKKED